MSKGREQNVYGFLWALSRRLYYEMSGAHGNPARAWFARVAVVLFLVAFGGPAVGGVLWTIGKVVLVLALLIALVWTLRWISTRP